MKQITCPHCGDTYPDFDVAHVCSKGPYAPKLKTKMNERIRELAEQNGFIHNWMPPGEQHDKLNNLEKFAELIVKKCANIVWDEAEKTMSSEVNDAGYKIIEYFGVAEREE